MKILVSMSGVKSGSALPAGLAPRVEDDLNKIAGSYDMMSSAHTEGMCKFLFGAASGGHPTVKIDKVRSFPVTVEVSNITRHEGDIDYSVTLTVNDHSVTLDPSNASGSRKLLAAAVNVWFAGCKGFRGVA